MERWIERYRRQAEERFRRLDAVLSDLQDAESAPADREQKGAAS